MWRGDLSPFGCGAVVKSLLAVYPIRRSFLFGAASQPNGDKSPRHKGLPEKGGGDQESAGSGRVVAAMEAVVCFCAARQTAGGMPNWVMNQRVKELAMV